MAEQYYNLQQVAAMLTTNRMTLREWLRDAHISPEQNPANKKERMLTRAQVEKLAQAHGRTLASDPPTEPATPADDGRVSALEQQLTTTLARITDLETRLRDYIDQQIKALERRLRESAPVPRDPPISRPASPPIASATIAPFRGIPADLAVLSKRDAARLVTERHGGSFGAERLWPWPPSALVSKEAALRWALAYVAGTTRQKPAGWIWRCSDPDCPCHQKSGM